LIAKFSVEDIEALSQVVEREAKDKATAPATGGETGMDADHSSPSNASPAKENSSITASTMESGQRDGKSMEGSTGAED